MSSLSEKNCIPCQGGVPPLPMEQKNEFKQQLDKSWSFTHENKRLQRVLKTKGFSQAMSVAVEIGEIADEQWHHPELVVGFGKLEICVWTHKIDDLVESDFVFAAKIDQLLRKRNMT